MALRVVNLAAFESDLVKNNFCVNRTDDSRAFFEGGLTGCEGSLRKIDDLEGVVSGVGVGGDRRLVAGFCETDTRIADGLEVERRLVWEGEGGRRAESEELIEGDPSVGGEKGGRRLVELRGDTGRGLTPGLLVL